MDTKPHAMIEGLYQATPLRAAQAQAVYPLVSLLHPSLTLEAWRAFVRRATRVPRHRGGLMAVRDRRSYVHAVFAYRLAEDLTNGLALRVTDVILGRLPGEVVAQAVIASTERLARELGSAIIAIDVSNDVLAASDRNLLHEAGFDAGSLIMTRRAAGQAHQPEA